MSMAKICPICSGSSGNCTYIDASSTAILVDAGISFKNLSESLKTIGADFEKISAVAVTHTHSDHIKGLSTLIKKTSLPLIASKSTLKTLSQTNCIPEKTKVLVADEGEIILNDIVINFFATSHDAEGSGGYTITLPDGRRCAVCTDLGIVTDTVKNAVTGCEAVLIESNHDIEMLKRGPYPAHLKLRILSDSGHLSNNACAALLPELLKSGTTRFILGHLSQHNNMPALALSAARSTLADIGAVRDSDYILNIARPKLSEVTVF